MISTKTLAYRLIEDENARGMLFRTRKADKLTPEVMEGAIKIALDKGPHEVRTWINVFLSESNA